MFAHDDILMRPVERKDLGFLREIRNQPSTWENLTSIDHISPEAQEAWFAGLADAKDRAYFTVCLNDLDHDFPILVEGNVIGLIRMDEIDTLNRSMRVGADVGPGYRGQGYGTKIYKMLLKYCFDYLGMHRVWLCVLDTNEVGIKLYVNSGFKLEGKYREAIWRDGGWHDYIVMSLLEGDYRA